MQPPQHLFGLGRHPWKTRCGHAKQHIIPNSSAIDKQSDARPLHTQDWTASLIRCSMNTFRDTSSVMTTEESEVPPPKVCAPLL